MLSLTLRTRKFFIKWGMTLNVIEGYIRSHFCLKIHVFLHIFSFEIYCYQTLYECQHYEDIKGGITELFRLGFSKT